MTDENAVPPSERFKCVTCNINFYKRYQTHKQCQNSLDTHLKKQCHRHNVERAAMGLSPERVYNLTAASRRLGELVERLGDRVEELEGVIRHEREARCSESEGSQQTSRPFENRPFEATDGESVVTASEPDSVAALFAPTATSSHQPPLRLQIREMDGTRCQETQPPLRPHVQRWVDQLDDYSVGTIEEGTEEEEEMSQRSSQYSMPDFAQSNIPLRTPTRLEASTEARSFRQFGPMMSRTHVFKPTERESEAVYGYDGKNYALMQQCGNMLQRVLIWVKQNLSGDRLATNVAFIQRTHAALNTQMRQRLNGEPTDDDDTDVICSRLYNILEHDFDS